MISDSQLLCTFTLADTLEDTLQQINQYFKLSSNRIYVLENIDSKQQLILTYNIDKSVSALTDFKSPHSTISVHRKKQTNTIYTINAINILIRENNNGVLDTNYKINWESLKNTVLVTAYKSLKLIHTNLIEIKQF